MIDDPAHGERHDESRRRGDRRAPAAPPRSGPCRRERRGRAAASALERAAFGRSPSCLGRRGSALDMGRPWQNPAAPAAARGLFHRRKWGIGAAIFKTGSIAGCGRRAGRPQEDMAMARKDDRSPRLPLHQGGDDGRHRVHDPVDLRQGGRHPPPRHRPQDPPGLDRRHSSSCSTAAAACRASTRSSATWPSARSEKFAGPKLIKAPLRRGFSFSRRRG